MKRASRNTRAGLPPIRPYGDYAGEVDQYRFVLGLSELGKAFLTVDGYASIGDG